MHAPKSLRFERLEQRLRLFEIGRIENFGEPAADLCEKVVCLIAPPESGACASYPVFVHRLAPLLRASFRPRLAFDSPCASLPFTSIRLGRGLSPPSY